LLIPARAESYFETNGENVVMDAEQDRGGTSLGDSGEGRVGDDRQQRWITLATSPTTLDKQVSPKPRER
jgi:hypothetical protein